MQYQGYGDEIAVTDQVLAWDEEWAQDMVEQEQEEDEVVPRQEDVVQKKKVMADLLHKLSSKVGEKVEQKRKTNKIENTILLDRPKIKKKRRKKKKTKIDTTETF